MYERVILAVMRCSRDKWISGKAVYELARRFAATRTISHMVCHFVFKDEDMYCTNYIGMLRGSRTFDLSSPMYLEFLAIAKKKPTKKTLPIELQILNLKLKEMKNER